MTEVATEWNTVRIVAPIGVARQIVERRFDPLTNRAFLAHVPPYGEGRYCAIADEAIAVVELEVEDVADQLQALTSRDADGEVVDEFEFRIVSPVAIANCRNPSILTVRDAVA
jgi:hypothetical protein